MDHSAPLSPAKSYLTITLQTANTPAFLSVVLISKLIWGYQDFMPIYLNGQKRENFDSAVALTISIWKPRKVA